MSSTYDPLVGQVLDGRYEILAKLARGGMATVYRARDQRLTRVVAVKVMRPDLGDDDEQAAKFDREARAAATICHPAVVGIFDQGTSAGRPYIVMEFIEGRTLRHLISREAPLSPEAALELMDPIVSALACAHEYGLVHRDIKPENVLISNRGQVKVADFGLARQICSPQLTATGVLVGTASYLPPELVTHSRPDSRSDVYSAGVVLFELLTGQKPHSGENNYQIAYRHVNVDIEPPSQRLLASGVRAWRIPDYLDAFVLACTARDPQSRPADGRIMLQRLREVRHQFALQPGVDSPELTSRLQPLRTTSGDITQPISQYPPARPRPLTNSVALAASAPSRTRQHGTPIPAPSRPHSLGGAAHQQSPTWEPVLPSSNPVAGSPISPGRPVGPHSEDSGRQPKLARTPVFPNLNISQEPVHRRRRYLVLLLSLILLAAGAGFGSWWWLNGRFTTVPSTNQISQAKAMELAQANDLRLESSTAYSEEVAAGLIISSDPAAGTRVLRGDVINVTISQGPERFEMPKVVGTELAAAKQALSQQQLKLGKVTEVFSAQVASGQVISASQAAGEQLKRDSVIDLEVSKGPRPIPISDYRGRKAELAKSELEQAGFEVSVTKENSAKVPAGEVISQTPNTGTGFRGEKISLVESLGPVMVTVPDVRFKSQDDGKAALEKLGFRVSIKYVTSFPLPLKIVSGTDPGRGTQLPEGSSVTLLVS